MRIVKRYAMAATVMATSVFAATAAAASAPTVRRCGEAHSRFAGRVDLYPWHMSCAAARATLAGSGRSSDRMVNFTADGADTFDAGAVRIAGRWWVCGGRMGYYFCGYPYRPAVAPGVGGGTTYRGPFTKEFVDESCADGAGCTRTTQIFQPPRSYR